MVKWSKTSPFHGGNPSSNLGRVTKEKTFERMSFSFSYRGENDIFQTKNRIET